MGPAQMIYSVVAVAVAASVSYLVMSGTMAVESQEFQNEILTQVSGVAHEVFDHIATRPFDARTDTLVYPDPPSGPEELTAQGSFGADCDWYATCGDIDDFHGQSVIVQREGTTYTVSVDVKYVNELDPTVLAGTNTFAKLVTLTIENNLVRDESQGAPLAINISRVYTYLKTTI